MNRTDTKRYATLQAYWHKRVREIAKAAGLL